MLRARFLGVRFLLIGLAVMAMAWRSAASLGAAVGVSADIGTGSKSIVGSGEASNVFFAYSNQTGSPSTLLGPAVVGPNNRTEYTQTNQPVKEGIPVDKGVKINAGSNSYTPVVSVGDKPKPTAANDIREALNSSSGFFHGSAFSYYYSFTGAPIGPTISAYGRIGALAPAGTTGAAAGAAFDPIEITSPSTYAPAFSAALELDNSLESGGVSVYATDSSVDPDLDDFVQDGSPVGETLWEVTIMADGPIGSAAALEVVFDLNPQALDEILFPTNFLSTLSYSNTAQEVADIDQYEDQTIDADFSPGAGGKETLSNFDPFPTGTMFDPLTGDIEYADGAAAAIQETPLPGAGAAGLVLMAVLGVGTLWKRGAALFTISMR